MLVSWGRGAGLAGRELVYVSAGGGRDDEILAIPLAWTSEAPVDPVVVLGAGRARFRAADLRELARRLAEVLR